MTPDEFWSEVRSRCAELDPAAELETPVSGRRFRIGGIEDDRIVVRFVDSGEERRLWREQFEVFLDGADRPIRVDDLQPGVEPYATVATLSTAFAVDGDEIRRAPEDTAGGESPYLVSPAEARRPPRRLHDDALLFAEHLERLDVADAGVLDTDSLTDCYVLSSDVQRGANRLRRGFREELLERLGPDQELHGRFGTVRQTSRERRVPKDDEAILGALDERGVPREWVLGVDDEKLDVVLSATDLEESDVYDVDESVYVQKTGVDEGAKFELLEGIADRLADLEGDEGEAIREDLADIEERIEDALAAD